VQVDQLFEEEVQRSEVPLERRQEVQQTVAEVPTQLLP
jgi:hypothetical protein